MRKILVFSSALVFLVACSSGGSDGTTGGGGGGGDQLLAPPPEGQGIQYKMISSLKAGQEIERVQFFQVPAGGLYVNREEVKYSPGSHHILIYKTPYETIPTKDIHGKSVDTSGVIDAPDGGTADWAIDGVVAGAQSASAPPIVNGLPPNVALKLEAGTILLMNTHYLNTTSAALDVEAAVNLWTVPAEQVTEEAGIFFYYDPIIRLPGHASSYAEMSCPVAADVKLVNLQTHMHARGLGGEAFVTAPGGKPESIYTSDSWQVVNVKPFEPALEIKKGSTIDYHCNYENAGPDTILQGLSTRDEMCMILGAYYPKDPKTELCSPDGSFDNLSMAGTWMGKGGKADCMTSIGCALAATDDDSTYACILDACPAAAPVFNEALKCFFAAGEACSKQCGQDAECQSECSSNACGTELDACGSATCK